MAKELPSWANNAVAWEGFVIDIEDHAAGSEGLPSPECENVWLLGLINCEYLAADCKAFSLARKERQ